MGEGATTTDRGQQPHLASTEVQGPTAPVDASEIERKLRSIPDAKLRVEDELVYELLTYGDGESSKLGIGNWCRGETMAKAVLTYLAMRAFGIHRLPWHHDHSFATVPIDRNRDSALRVLSDERRVEAACAQLRRLHDHTIAVLRAFAANRRRAEESAEVDGDKAAAALPERSDKDHTAQWRSLRRVIAQHRQTDERWLEYELNFAKLLDFPVMTDMRDPLTVDFHKAKLRADLLRPVKAEDLLDDREAAERYLAAVADYATAFNAAEAEAIRRRRSDFSREGQQRIARAQSLLRVASDSAAAPQERQNAYDLACKELDGLLVLPSAAQAGIERGISGQLEG